MSKFKPKTILILRPDGTGMWSLTRGNIKTFFKGLYRTLQAAYTLAMIMSQEQIWKIEIAVFRRE